MTTIALKPVNHQLMDNIQLQMVQAQIRIGSTCRLQLLTGQRFWCQVVEQVDETYYRGASMDRIDPVVAIGDQVVFGRQHVYQVI